MLVRRPAVAAAVLLACLVATGCGGGDEPAAGDGSGSPSPSATTSEGSSDATGAAEGSSGPAAADPEAPASVEEFCAPYLTMVAGIEGLDRDSDPDALAAQIGTVLRTWAEQVPDLERPPGISDDVWDGLGVLADRIVALPDPPSMADIDAVESDLPPDQQRSIVAAQRWFRKNCNVG